MAEELEKMGMSIGEMVELVEGSNQSGAGEAFLSAGSRCAEKLEMPNLDAGEHVLLAQPPSRQGVLHSTY